MSVKRTLKVYEILQIAMDPARAFVTHICKTLKNGTGFQATCRRIPFVHPLHLKSQRSSLPTDVTWGKETSIQPTFQKIEIAASLAGIVLYSESIELRVTFEAWMRC